MIKDEVKMLFLLRGPSPNSVSSDSVIDTLKWRRLPTTSTSSACPSTVPLHWIQFPSRPPLFEQLYGQGFNEFSIFLVKNVSSYLVKEKKYGARKYFMWFEEMSLKFFFSLSSFLYWGKTDIISHLIMNEKINKQITNYTVICYV